MHSKAHLYTENLVVDVLILSAHDPMRLQKFDAWLGERGYSPTAIPAKDHTQYLLQKGKTAGVYRATEIKYVLTLYNDRDYLVTLTNKEVTLNHWSVVTSQWQPVTG